MNFSINETALVRNQLFVEKVNDGDGLIVKDLNGKYKEEIRFLGIDAPESKQCRKQTMSEINSGRKGNTPASSTFVGAWSVITQFSD